MKEENFVNKKNAIKIVLAMLLLAVACLGILFFVRFLTNISVGADKPETLLNGELEKYINFKISNEDKGTLVQYGIEFGIEQKEEQFSPIRENELKISLNQIDGKYPYSVKVIAKSTEMTNGKTENIEENFQYDANSGIVVINTSNINENDEPINSSKPSENAKDKYSIICYYDSYIEDAKERELSIKVALNASLFDGDTGITEEKEFKVVVSEDVGELTSIAYDSSDVVNGYIKSNIINGTTYNTTYTETQNITVSKKEAQEKIKIIENNTFIRENKNENDEELTKDLGNNGNLVYKNTKIRKEDITNLLGEEGIVEISDVSGNIIGTINKDTQFQEDGTLVINYENEPQAIIIKTSKIINEGILKLENSKEIKSTMLETDVKIKTTSKLLGINENVEIVNSEEVKTDVEIFSNDYEKIIDIKDAKTTVNMDLNTSEWTNKQQNEVTFDVYANANTVNDNMLKNPAIKIELPSEVEKVILGQSSAIYTNGLELQNPYLETNENGNIVIAANLIGTQTKYDENTLGLVTNVKISATIILKKDIENTIGNINLTFTNQYTLDKKNEVKNKSYEIKITSYLEENIVEENEKISTYANTSLFRTIIENVEGLTLEVIPVRGDTVLKDEDTVYEGEFIKYNIKVTNTSDKQIDNIKVVGSIPEGTTYAELEADYYNYAGKYEYNYNNTVKEKIIEIGSLEAGKSISKFYEVQVNSLEEGENEKATETTIQTYVENNQISNYSISNIIKKAEVQVFLGASLDSIRDKWNYEVDVIGDEDTEVTIELTAPKEFEYIYVVNCNTGKKNDSESVTVLDNKITFKVKPGNYMVSGTIDPSKITEETAESKVELSANVVAKLNGIQYASNENRIIFEYESATIVMTSKTEGEEVRYKDEIDYEITITNTGRTNLNREEYEEISLNVLDYLPAEINPISVTYETWEKNDEEGFIKKEDTKDISIKSEDENGNELPAVDLYVSIPYMKSIVINVKAEAGFVYQKTKIENNATFIGSKINSRISNTVSHIILPYNYDDISASEDTENPNNPNNPDNPSNPNNPTEEDKKYSISGVAWLDENHDGQRQKEEKLLNGITAMLVNTANSSTIQAKEVTDSNGAYNFSGLEKGNYILVFKYDTDTYSITEYQKSGIATSLNSDAISKEITLMGVQTKVGLTDTISLEASVTNIDIGLTRNKICDLKLDKYISKVQVKTTSGTKEYTYDNSQLAKVEIKAKEIQGATVVVTYKIVVSNEGELPAYATKIVDYIPEGMDFSSDLNKTWVKTNSGELTNISVGNQKIEAGENVELTLVVTKAMTENSTGTFTNIAEIEEMTNSLGIKDTDSTPGNKVTTEDDYSKADLIISVSTGGIVLWISVVIIGLAIIALSIKFGVSKVLKVYLFAGVIVIGLLVQNITVNAETKTSSITESNLPDLYLELTENNFGKEAPSVFTVLNTRGGKIQPIKTGDKGDCKDKNVEVVALEYWYRCTGVTKNKVSSEVKEEKYTDFKLNSPSSEKDIKVTKNNGNIILGPFKVKATLSGGSYSCIIYTDDANKSIKVTEFYSDSNGKNKIEGDLNNKAFYLKVSEKDISNKSIKKIKLEATKEISIQRTYTYKGLEAEYDPVNEDGYLVSNCQGVKFTFNYTETSNKTEKRTPSVEWEIKYGDLEITKKDKDNKNITLNGVEIRVENEDLEYRETFKTNQDGKIKINNLYTGTYLITEVSNSNYGYNVMSSGKVKIEGGMTNTFTLENEKQTGNLQIVKKDYHQLNKALKGVSFRIKKIEIADINKDGIISISDVTLLKKYISSGKSDNGIEPNGRGDINKDGKINDDDVEILQEYLSGKNKRNIGEGYIKAIIDEKNYKTVTGKVNLTSMEITANPEEATIFTTNEEGKIEIINMLTGDYVLEEIDVGDNYGYEIDNEYITWNNGQTEGIGANIPITIKKQSSKETDASLNSTSIEYSNIVNVYNRQKYIKLSGYAWEDIGETKQTTGNKLYEQNTEDKRLENIAVTLVDEDGNAIAGTTTDKNGEYTFEKVEIESIDGGGYIKFLYNGFSYQTVDVNCINAEGIKVENGNTAKEYEEQKNGEIVDSREKFNNKYATITKDGVYKDDGTILSQNLFYNSDDYTSTLDLTKANPKYGYEGQKYPIMTSAHEDIYFIIARTEVRTNTDNKNEYRLFGQNETIEQMLKEGKDEITNINLGLYEREQPDIALLKDLYNVKISVNGYNHIYKYGQRLNHLVNNKEDEEAVFNAGVKFKSGKQDDYNNISYSRAIYTADYNYKNTQEKSKELKVYATYKIVIKNESTNLKVRVNEIVDNYHEAFKLEKIGTKIDDGTGEITGEIVYTNDDDNKTISIKTDTKISGTNQGNNTTEIYIQFSITKNKLGEFLHEATGDNQTYKTTNNLENMAEITSYSVFDESGNIYAGIDKDSKPGNADIAKAREGKREDDTSLAPGFVIEVKNSRKITGIVFLDESDFGENEDQNATHTAKTRNGNGIYDKSESKISGVKVELYKKSDLIKDTYGNYKLGNGATPVGKTIYNKGGTSTINDGEFTIQDFYPGEYVIVYTWGNKTYIDGIPDNSINVNDYKGTIYVDKDRAKKSDWYLNTDTRYSDAMDNYTTRKEIDKEDSTITTMDSITPTMEFGIEVGDNLTGNTSGIDKIEFIIPNVDFGITERARQLLNIEKTVDSVEISVGASTIAYGKIEKKNGKLQLTKESSKYLTYIPPSGEQSNGMIKAEIDSELLHGAKIKIKYNISVINNSEIDYDNINYYLYGDNEGLESKIIKYKPTKICDYLDNSLSYSEDAWTIQTLNNSDFNNNKDTIIEKYLKNNLNYQDSYIGYENFKNQYKDAIEDWTQYKVNKAREKRLNGKTILQYNENIDIVNPGNKKDIATINVEGELTNTQEIDLNNDVEVTNVERQGETGRKINPSSLYDRAESVVVTSPTGDNQNYILIIGMGISFLVTLGTGIVFIKKKVL